jgi:hypothetical protein
MYQRCLPLAIHLAFAMTGLALLVPESLFGGSPISNLCGVAAGLTQLVHTKLRVDYGLFG